MSTLHILRSEPDGLVRELILAVSEREREQIALYEENVDYHSVVDALFRHHRVISWW
jgi:CO dehydrogenase/acetyl-CoA synthase delta subunit